MDASDRKSCMCPLCILYKTNVASVQRWASERHQKRKAKFDEKLQNKRDYHEGILKKLRDKHASQMQAFEETIKQASADDLDEKALEAQYKDELLALDANLKQNVGDLITQFERDYIERTSQLDGFIAHDVGGSEGSGSSGQWDEQCDPESACSCADDAASPDTQVALVVDENARLKVVRSPSVCTD